jgi:uncharacterized Zn finger protein (UPF0148 family)
MAKTKTGRGMPSKQCPNCGATVHARKFQCPECDYVFVAKNGKAKVKRGRVKRVQAAAVESPAPIAASKPALTDPLAAMNEAAETIRSLGGLEKVKDLIAKAKEIEAAVERLGGMKEAEEMVGALEMLKRL